MFEPAFPIDVSQRQYRLHTIAGEHISIGQPRCMWRVFRIDFQLFTSI